MHNRTTGLALAACLLACPPVLSSAPLGPAPDAELPLSEAVSLAVAGNDPSVAQWQARARAQDERGVADAAFPDPQLRFGLANFPTDSFAFDQEPMTQVQLGLRQAFPRGATRTHQAALRSAESASQRMGAQLQRLQIVLATRQAWLELYYWQRAAALQRQSRAALAALVDVISVAVASGSSRTQEVLRTELELSLLDDRLLDTARNIDVARADLARQVGADNAARPLPATPAELPDPPALDVLLEHLGQHPAVALLEGRVRVGRHQEDLAREQLRPGFALDLGYGARGAGRADFASAMLVIDVPLRAAQRQDRRIAAAQYDTAAAEFERGARLLDLQRQLQRVLASWQHLGDRTALFQRVVLERAGANAEAALTGYQNRANSFAELVRARLAELDAQLQLQRLQTDRALAQAELLFLAGGGP